MMLAGVFRGANTEFTVDDSKPGTPESATVGNPGTNAVGFALVTANALTLPDLVCAAMEPDEANITCTSPESSPVIAGPAPLKGMRTMLTPAMALNNSAERCVEAPVPPEP